MSSSQLAMPARETLSPNWRSSAYSVLESLSSGFALLAILETGYSFVSPAQTPDTTGADIPSTLQSSTNAESQHDMPSDALASKKAKLEQSATYASLMEHRTGHSTKRRPPEPGETMALPLITLEEHFVSNVLRDSPYAATLGLDLFPSEVSRKLLSLQAERLEDMNDAGIAVQVVSHNPGAGALPLDMCRAANDQLYTEGVSRSNGRLAGFAALPMSSPLQAAGELSRCVRNLGYVGALISNHAQGHFFDDESYWPVFEKAQDLDVPIYLHPTFPDQAQASRFEGNFSKAATEAMSAYAWGWHSDVGLHFVRLFASGLFDRCPRLKLILGHNGEMTPFMIERIQRFCPRWGSWQRSLSTVWAENVWFTTSGMFTLGPLACLLRTTTVDKIMFSVDYPFEKNADGRRFLEDVEKSGLLTLEELEMVAFRNAENLLKLKAVRAGRSQRL